MGPLRSNNPTLSLSPTLSTPFNMLWRPPSLTSTPSAYTNPLSPSALSLPPLLLLMLLPLLLLMLLPPSLSTMLLPMLIPPMLLPLLLLPLLSSRPKLKIFGNPPCNIESYKNNPWKRTVQSDPLSFSNPSFGDTIMTTTQVPFLICNFRCVF